MFGRGWQIVAVILLVPLGLVVAIMTGAKDHTSPTKVAGVDAVIGEALAGDSEAVLARVRSRAPCGPIANSSEAVTCPNGVAPGTSVPVLPVSRCGAAAPVGEAASAALDAIFAPSGGGSNAPLALHSVYRGIHAPAGRVYGLVLTRGPDVRVLELRASGELLGVSFICAGIAPASAKPPLDRYVEGLDGTAAP